VHSYTVYFDSLFCANINHNQLAVLNNTISTERNVQMTIKKSCN